jgi:hypothetical protein
MAAAGVRRDADDRVVRVQQEDAFVTRIRPIAILAAALLAASALAQPPTSLAGLETPIPPAPTTGHRRPATIEAVRLGWRGHLLSDCWSPARIYISGNPQINNGAFGGTLEFLYAQDGSQTAQITVPIATTPGRVTPVEVAIALPQNASRLTVTLYNDNGRPVDSRRYARGSDSLPATILHATPIILAVAERSGISPSVTKAFEAPGLRAVGVAPNTPNFGQPTPVRNPLDDTVSITVTSEDLPESWAAYEGVTAVVIGADEIAALPQARLAALRQWVLSGGCVITRVGIGTTGLAKFFEDTPWRVEVLEQRTVAPGSELQRVFGETIPLEKDGKTIETRAALHDSLPSRVLTLGAAPSPTDTDADVWRIRWSPRDTTRVNGLDTQGLLAEGPMGFGWVVVLATDPALLGTGADDAAARAAWRDIMRPVSSELATRARDSQEYAWGERGSGPDRSARIALRSTLNHLSSVPALGDGAFIIIGLCLLALAIAVGPFDAIFLGVKRKRQFSWATALLWIGIASIIAAAAPPLVRSGESKLQRLRVVDAIITPDATLAYHVGVTTIFAGSGGTVALTPADNAPTTPSTTSTALDSFWFRGISPLYVQPFDNTDPLSRFATVQRGSASDRARSNQLDQASPMRMGQWTFRTLMEQGPSTALAAEMRRPLALERDGTTWTVRTALPPGTLREAHLRVGQVWQRLTLMPGGELRGAGDADTGNWAMRDAIARAEYYRDLDFQCGMALELPGVRERSRTIEARLASGRWGVLYLHTNAAPPTLLCRRLNWAGAGEPYASAEETVYRILVPLGDSSIERSAWNVTLPKSMTSTDPDSSPRRAAPSPPIAPTVTTESQVSPEQADPADNPPAPVTTPDIRPTTPPELHP